MYDRISDVCEITAILFMLHQCFGKTKFRDFFNIYNMLYVVFHLIAWYVILEWGYQRFHILLLYGVLFIFALCYFHQKCIKTCINMVVAIAVVGVCQLIWGMLIIPWLQEEVISVALVNILTLLSVLLLARRIRFYDLLELLYTKKSIVNIFGGGILLISGYFFINSFLHKQATVWEVLFVIAVEGIFGYLVYEWSNMKKELLAAEKDLRLYEEYNASFLALQKDLRRKQHDYDNHLSAIYSMWYITDSYTELVNRQREYIDKLIYDNRFNKLLCQGECPVITAFIYTKFSEAESRGIAIRYKISVKDLSCSWSIHDMVTVLGNILDNAFHAVMALPNKEIVFEMREYPNSITIQLSNPVPGDTHKNLNMIFKEGYSTKEEGHGLGLVNVKKIVLQHQDVISVETFDEKEEPWIMFSIKISKK